MANLISKIKAPNNTEYLLKDSTLAADTGISIADIDSNNQRKIKNTGVTGVKGNSESAYRTGQVNLTAANLGAKATQSAVNDVTADGTSVTFISKVTQNAQGVISPVKKTVATMGAASADAAGSAGLVPAPAAGKQGQYLRGDGTWATPTNTTYTFDGTYNSSTNKAATVSTVTNAINALDVAESTGTTLQTITAISETNGKIAATYSDIASASTSGKGVVQLSSATNSTSTSLAATASAVKAAYDLAASKTANTGTVTKVTPGNGLINGTSGTSQTAITSTGTISIKEGGVTNAMLAGSIENGKLSNSKVTIAGNDVSLGGSVAADTLRESLGLSNAMHFVGTTTTAMSDGLTTKNVTINSKTYTPNSGDVVLYSDAEFVWTGSAWERLGRDSSFKTTQTAVADPSADGTDTAFIDSITQNANGVISPHKASLPTASTSTAGIMKVGTGLSASSGTVNVSYGTAANTACQGNDSRLSNARTPTSHTHGNLTNDGKITTTATIANGDKLVIVDSDTTAANKVTGSSITFDGSTTTKALTPKGTWETFVKSQYVLPTAGDTTLGGIKMSGEWAVVDGETRTNEDFADEGELLRTIVLDGGKLYAIAKSWDDGDVVSVGGDENPIRMAMMTKAQKEKLDGIAAGANKYTLPNATTSTLGGVKVGTGLNVSSGTVSVAYGTAANTACQGNDSRLSNARTPTSHTHGNLTNDGKITTTATIANGDKLVIVDSDTTAASKITGSSITFDGSTTTKALTPKGTWETFVKSQYTLPAATTSALGGIKLSSASDTTPIGSLTVPIGTLASDGLTYAYTPVAGTDMSGNNTPLGMIQPDKGFVQETTVVSGVELPRVGVWSVATMGGATSSADGTFGAPPSPKKGDQAKFLRGDATWQSVITAHRTYTAFTGKPAANATPGFGESFTISQISQSTTGQVSGTDRTVTIPALPTASTSVAGIVKLGTAAGTAAQGNHNHDSTYVNVSGDTMTGTLSLQPASGEGGELHLCASTAKTNEAGIVLDHYGNSLRIFGIASADGTTKTGTGTTLVIDPYAKTITGGYTITGSLSGNATSASKLSNTSAIGGTDHPVYFTNGGVPAKTTYRMAGTNATATTALAITDNLDTGIWYVNGTNSSSLYSQTDGAAYVNKYSDSWIHEIYGDYRTGHIAVRGKNNGTWKSWYKVLDSGNYDDYAIPNSIGTAAGDIIYWSSSGTPARLAKGSNGQVLKINSSGVPAWAADNNDNNYVSQSGSTTANWRKVLLHYKDDAASTTAVTSSTNVVYSAVGVSVQPSTGTIRTNAYNVADHVTLQYNSTDASLDFVFA